MLVAGCAMLAGCGTTTGTPVAATPTAEQSAVPSSARMSDTTDPRRRAVLEFALTTRREHFQDLAVDFQEFVSTVRVEGG